MWLSECDNICNLMFLVYWFKLKYFVFSEECKNDDYLKGFFRYFLNDCVFLPYRQKVFIGINIIREFFDCESCEVIHLIIIFSQLCVN